MQRQAAILNQFNWNAKLDSHVYLDLTIFKRTFHRLASCAVQSLFITMYNVLGSERLMFAYLIDNLILQI